MTAKILIVEDEAAIQQLLAFNVEQAGFKPLLAQDGQSAWERIDQDAPDLILLDWMLPQTSGLIIARQLRSKPATANIPIIMLTARSEERDKILGLDTGVDDYMTKPFSPRELIARIRAVLRRKNPPTGSAPMSLGGLELCPTTEQVKANGIGIQLGPIEYRILHFFMCYPHRVYSRRQLLEHAWNRQTFAEERTVDVHIRHLRAALEPVQLDHLIQTVRGFGYRFSPESA